jgi:glycerol-3-phosphate O-acyltransferase/dihydroxyacetone phosphate acyltransferase
MSFRPLYYFSKLLFNFTIRTYYRKIVLRGEENLCPGKPVIIAMNHPNAFMDPIAFATVVKPEMNFLARGDVFTKFLTPILRSVGIIPIYRLSDSGREGVQKNDETFRIVTQYLKSKKYVIIFAEGISLHGRRLNNLKKGCARIVLGALDTLKDDEIRIVPVGMNYQSNPSKFRQRLLIEIGKPILISDYKEIYAVNPAKAINEVTQDLQMAMRRSLIHIEDKENNTIVEQIEEIYLEELLNLKGADKNNLELSHEFTSTIVEKINFLSKNNPERIDSLKQKINVYIKKLSDYGIRDKLLRKEYHRLSDLNSIIYRLILFVLGLPVWFAGLITNYVPYFICWKLPGKLTKDIEWFSAIAGTVGSFIFLFYHLIQFSIFWMVTGDSIYLTVYMAVTFLSGWFSLHFSPFRKKLFGSMRMNTLKRKENKFAELIKSREVLVREIKDILV